MDLGFDERSTSVILEEVMVKMTGTKSLETWDLRKGFDSQTFLGSIEKRTILNIAKSKNWNSEREPVWITRICPKNTLHSFEKVPLSSVASYLIIITN